MGALQKGLLRSEDSRGGALRKENFHSSILHLLFSENVPHCGFWLGRRYLHREEDKVAAICLGPVKRAESLASLATFLAICC